LKTAFKSAATTASAMDGPFRDFYQIRMANGMLPAMARLTLARSGEEPKSLISSVLQVARKSCDVFLLWARLPFQLQ
jgi:hypothetical protein